MIVVADSSPVNYLILIEEIEILTRLYGKVVIPRTVREELLRSQAPDMVRKWVNSPPAWIEVRAPETKPDDALSKLDAGERDAILLAAELTAEQLIVDDREGRRLAKQRGISVIGTLGVLKAASDLGFLDLRSVVERLQATSFFVSPEVLSSLFKN